MVTATYSIIVFRSLHGSFTYVHQFTIIINFTSRIKLWNTYQDETEDNSQEDEKRDEVDPADRILPFHQEEDLLQFKDDHFSGTQDGKSF